MTLATGPVVWIIEEGLLWRISYRNRTRKADLENATGFRYHYFEGFTEASRYVLRYWPDARIRLRPKGSE